MKHNVLLAALFALSLSACGEKEAAALAPLAEPPAPEAEVVAEPSPVADDAAATRANPNEMAESHERAKKAYQDAVLADPNASTKELAIIAGERMREMGYNTNTK